MQTFFADIKSLDRFTRDLGLDPALQCPHCKMQGQLVSHGFVYKKHSGSKIAVGKRIFCSNRQGKKGCGRTKRLYLNKDIPTLHYGTRHLLIFLTSLLSVVSIQKAYQEATGTCEARNASRWIGKLWMKFTQYRGLLKTDSGRAQQLGQFSTERFQRLLPTMDRLIREVGAPHLFQLHYQVSFL